MTLAGFSFNHINVSGARFAVHGVNVSCILFSIVRHHVNLVSICPFQTSTVLMNATHPTDRMILVYNFTTYAFSKKHESLTM